jgi:hypothetical protein
MAIDPVSQMVKGKIFHPYMDIHLIFANFVIGTDIKQVEQVIFSDKSKSINSTCKNSLKSEYWRNHP